jgi:hypothetical protein
LHQQRMLSDRQMTRVVIGWCCWAERWLFPFAEHSITMMIKLTIRERLQHGHHTHTRVGCTRPQQTVTQEIALHTQTSYTTPGTMSDKQPTARLMPHIPRGGPEQALEGGGSLTGTPWWWGATKHPSCTTGSIHNLQKGHKYPTSRPCQATRTIRHINASTQHRRHCTS